MSDPREDPIDGDAIVWCDGSFDTPEGKTAHGLVRFTRRYRVRAVIDRKNAGADAGAILDGRPASIPVVADLEAALALAGGAVRSLVIGLAPDGGRLPAAGRAIVEQALRAGLDVDSGLHDFLSDDPRLSALAQQLGRRLRDVRKTPPRSELHGFSGRIDQVGSFRVAVLGTDSAVGKRTTAWLLVFGWERRGLSAELIGTGQTAWLQGARYGMILDSMINDFVAGELEHAALSAWDERRPDAMVIEGQGSLMNPAYPGGLEILAASRPHAVVLQHAPARRDYDGFPGFPIQPIERQIEAIELIGERPVVAITINHEGLDREGAAQAARELTERTGRVACDPLRDGVEPVLDALEAARRGASDGRG